MSAEFAVELLGDAPGRRAFERSAAGRGYGCGGCGGERWRVARRGGGRGAGGAGDEELAARGGDDGAGAVPSPRRRPRMRDVAEVRNAIGLHARPAARFVETVRRFDADVRVAKPGGGEPVRATSLTNVVALGARFGDTLKVTASGRRPTTCAGAGAAGGRGVWRRRRRSAPLPRPVQLPPPLLSALATACTRLRLRVSRLLLKGGWPATQAGMGGVTPPRPATS